MRGMGMNRIKTNPVTEKLRSGQPAVGTFLGLGSPHAAEMLASMGWDWLVVDVEHSPIGFETIVNCFRAAQLGGAVPMARIPWNETIWIQRTLDAGALGLVVPMVNSAEDARAVVNNMKYATRGQRSFGGSRVAQYIDGDYRAWADEHIAIIVMIETIQAVENVHEILATEGVDGCFVGPTDLALSMGIDPRDAAREPQHEAAIMQVLAAAKQTGKAAGKHCFSATEVNTRIQQGFQFLALSSDGAFMAHAAREAFDGIDFNGK